jgi:hypothetical protein
MEKCQSGNQRILNNSQQSQHVNSAASMKIYWSYERVQARLHALRVSYVWELSYWRLRMVEGLMKRHCFYQEKYSQQAGLSRTTFESYSGIFINFSSEYLISFCI